MKYLSVIVLCVLFSGCATFKGVEDATCPAIGVITSEACKVACSKQDKVDQELCVILCEEATDLAKQEIEERL